LLHRKLSMKTVAIACLLLSACTAADNGASGGVGGKADELSPDQIPSLADAYGLRIDGLFRRCVMDFDDDDDDGDTTECDDSQDVKIDELTLFGLWSPEQDGPEVHGPLTVCRARSISDGTELSLDDKLIRSLPALDFGGRMMSVTGAAWLISDPTAAVIGAKLDDAFEDSLPTDEDDPRVVDVDGDGEPGVSISVGFGSVFMAMQMSFQTEGPIASDGSSTGAADLHVQQEVYGDSIPFVDARARAEESKETNKGLGGEHTYRLSPIVGSADCDDVIERLGSKE
jgi:hypothetical protein